MVSLPRLSTHRNARTGTPLARLRLRGHWLTYLQCIPDARAVRAAAGMHGVHQRLLDTAKLVTPAQMLVVAAWL